MQAVIEYFSTHGSDYVTYVIEHIEVSVLAVLLAMIVGIPLGIISARFHWFAMLSTGIWGTFRIIPSLAILVLLIPFMGTGVKPAVIALTILAIPPILINTILGFQTVPGQRDRSGRGNGYVAGQAFLVYQSALGVSRRIHGNPDGDGGSHRKRYPGLLYRRGRTWNHYFYGAGTDAAGSAVDRRTVRSVSVTGYRLPPVPRGKLYPQI